MTHIQGRNAVNKAFANNKKRCFGFNFNRINYVFFAASIMVLFFSHYFTGMKKCVDYKTEVGQQETRNSPEEKKSDSKMIDETEVGQKGTRDLPEEKKLDSKMIDETEVGQQETRNLPEEKKPESKTIDETEVGQQETRGLPEEKKLESKMILLEPQPLTSADKTPKNWKIPVARVPKCPYFCGEKMQFAPFARDPDSNLTLEKGVGSKTFYRVHRPDWIKNMTKAVKEIDKHGGMDTNSFCGVFDSCKARNKRQSRHSTTYLVCSDFYMIHASNILVGSAREKLPGFLREEGDNNIFCHMARFISKIVEQTIFPSVGWKNKKCIVQEFFINQQLRGSKTLMHSHPDDIYGGVFYLDVPKDTKMCFHDSEESPEKKKWWEHAPELTERLFPDAPGEYPGYFEPRSGDVIFFPVGWAQHWVPEMHFARNEKRTSVVFNMVCF